MCGDLTSARPACVSGSGYELFHAAILDKSKQGFFCCCFWFEYGRPNASDAKRPAFRLFAWPTSGLQLSHIRQKFSLSHHTHQFSIVALVALSASGLVGVQTGTLSVVSSSASPPFLRGFFVFFVLSSFVLVRKHCQTFTAPQTKSTKC